MIFFFKQKTAYEMRISDWSSDVCSSDLMRGGKSGDRRHHRHHLAQRQHGFDAFAGDHDRTSTPEPDPVSEQMTHRAARIGDRRLVAAVECQPCAVNPGDGTTPDRKSTRLNSSH